MIPAPGVTFCNLDSADVVDDVLSVFMLLSDGSLVGVCLPIADLIRRGLSSLRGGPRSLLAGFA